jgi:hypothetical protein
MTAPDQRCSNVKKLLLIKRRPHLTLIGHSPNRLAHLDAMRERNLLFS